ncbi:MAG: hypothetical protein PVF50_05360 [Gammaproteobacteria bacterium]|jgi:hypothetical protein
MRAEGWELERGLDKTWFRDVTAVTESSKTPRPMRECPFSKVRDYSAAIEIGTEQFNCWRRCVYAMESPESAAAALRIIRDHQQELDVFGRAKGSRAFGLSHLLRVGPHAFSWASPPAYLEQQRPATTDAIERMLRADVDAPHYRGRIFEFSHSASHPESAWLARASSLLAAEIESAANMMADELAAVLRESSGE